MVKFIDGLRKSLKQRTHSEEDVVVATMRGRGATEVFRNLAFDEADQNVASIASPSGRCHSPAMGKAQPVSESLKNNFVGDGRGLSFDANQVATTPRVRADSMGAAVWAAGELPSHSSVPAPSPLGPSPLAPTSSLPPTPAGKRTGSMMSLGGVRSPMGPLSSAMFGSVTAGRASSPASVRPDAMVEVPRAASPTLAHRAASPSQRAASPASHRASVVKRPKNSTAIQELGAYDPAMDEESDSEEDGSRAGDARVIHVRTRNSANASAVNLMSSVSATSSMRMWEDEVKRLVAAGRHEDAIRWAAPTDALIRCTIRRVRNFLGHTIAYQLFLESGDTFLLAARKRMKSKASNFVLSTSQDDLGKDSDHCIAKLRANFVGTEYSLVSRTGLVTGSHDSNDGSQDLPTGGGPGRVGLPAEPFSREELAVHYKQTALTAKGGPRMMLVASPLPEVAWAPSAPDGSDCLANCLDAARRRELSPRLERQLCMLATRPPEWDSNLKAYTLDFHGRVRASSVKNFQLVHWDHNTDRKGSDLVLQFGKMDDKSDDFALDFTYPLTLQKAFGIALASTDTKLCYAL